MKKIAWYAGLMVVVIVLLPFLIVKGCGHPAEKPSPGATTGSDEIKISVYNSDTGRSVKMNLEQYIMGVVAAEMPAGFDLEALKAQAVAARTFAYGRLSGAYQSKKGVHDGIDVCTDSTHCQAWISKQKAMKKWNLFFAASNWSKIEKAVKGTKGLIVVYNGTIANTLFHASSPGKTENSEDVWAGKSVPYLRSVISSGDEVSSGYITAVQVSREDFLGKLKKTYPQHKIGRETFSRIKISGYTEGGRVKSIKIGDITLSGIEFRALFGLRSADFSIERTDEESLTIITKGYGHGVGMSQWGADSLAKKGGTFIEILKHYYTGVDVMSIREYEKICRK